MYFGCRPITGILSFVPLWLQIVHENSRVACHYGCRLITRFLLLGALMDAERSRKFCGCAPLWLQTDHENSRVRALMVADRSREFLGSRSYGCRSITRILGFVRLWLQIDHEDSLVRALILQIDHKNFEGTRPYGCRPITSILGLHILMVSDRSREFSGSVSLWFQTVHENSRVRALMVSD